MIGICCNLLSELKNSYERMAFDVVCHGKNGVAKYSYGSIYCLYDVTWNGLFGSHDDYVFYVCRVRTATLICYVCICPSDGV